MPQITFAQGEVFNAKIENIAYMSYQGLLDNQLPLAQLPSNAVYVQIEQPTISPTKPATIAFKNIDFKNTILTSKLIRPLYIETIAAQCNQNSNLIEQVRLKVYSQLTHDVVDLIVEESDIDSGVFHFSLTLENKAQADLDDEILQTLKRDQVSVIATSCVSSTNQNTIPLQDVNSSVLIEPYSIVFDAKTQLPISGAKVILLNELGQPVEYLNNESNKVIAPESTNNLGEFYYPELQAGRYKLVVDTTGIAGKNYQFASNKEHYPLASFTQYNVDAVSAYGNTFTLNAKEMNHLTDIPLDPIIEQGNLTIEKTVRSTNVEVGDFSYYDITITNNSERNLSNVELEDQLPYGFKYIVKSVKLNGQNLHEPQGAATSTLRFDIGTLATQQTAKLEYKVLVGHSALNGDGINRARAHDKESQLRSNEAQAKVNINAGIFRSEGFIIGKVFTDCNRNGIQDLGESGVPGVRLYLEDGSYVITDREGKYDFYGIRPITHVLKIDPTTLPHAELVLLSSRQAGDASSRFIDLKRGEIHRADFAIADQAEICSTDLLTEIVQRQQQSALSQLNLEKAINQQLSIDAPQYISRSRRLEQSEGCLTQNDGKNCLPLRPTELLDTQALNLKLSNLSLEQQLQQHPDSNLVFLNVYDQQVLLSNQTHIQLQGLMGATQRLWLNGNLVEDHRRSKLSTLVEKNKQGLEYIGLDLQAGKNNLRLEQLDFAGNVRETKTIQLIVPGAIERLHLIRVQEQVMANGRDHMQIRVQLLDKHGVKVGTRSPINIESNLGLVQLKDLNPNEPGIQQFIEGGELLINVLSPTAPAKGTLKISSGLLQQELSLDFTADLRPLIAVGLLEGHLNFNAFDLNNIQSTTRNEGFEEQLNEIAAWDKSQLNGRAALFLKGKVRGDYLLTLAYDSTKSSSTRLFRDIQPDEYYPIYGDAASKGFEAQSTGKLYLRLDKGRHYAMYGDYVTRTEQDEGLALGQYNRSLTGIKVGYDSDRLSTSAFSSNTKSRQVTQEQRAFGLTGPYSLTGISTDLMLENSEKVEIITRDRNNSTQIIERELLTRFVDYEIDTYNKTIYLKQPVSSVDAEFNPRYIRVTVEAEDIGAEYNVSGSSLRYNLNSNVKIGGSWVNNNDPLHPQKLKSLNSVIQLAKSSQLLTEIAQSEDHNKSLNQNSVGKIQDGVAARIEFAHQSKIGQIRAYHHQAETSFYNDAATISAGQIETGIKFSLPAEKIGLVRIEAIRNEDENNNYIKQGMLASVEHQFNPSFSLEAGVRHYDESNQSVEGYSETYNGTTARLKANTRLPWRASTAFLEYEQDVVKEDRQVLAVGGTAQVLPNTELYARHELISSLDGLYALNSQNKTNRTLFGISSQYMKDATVFSEYRVADSMSQREAEAAVGLRNRWQIQPKVYLSTSFERTETLGETQTATNDSTALSLAFEYLVADNWKASTRFEARYAEQQNDFLHSLAYARQMYPELSLLVKNSFNLTKAQSSERGDVLRNRAQVGLAWRDQLRNRFDLLGKFEHYYEDNKQDLIKPVQRQNYIGSIHTNFHPLRALTVSSQYAAKWAIEQHNSLQSNAISQLIRGRVLYDLNERWDSSINMGTLWDQNNTQYLLGAEVGYLVATNVWISVGYNFFGYQEEDLAYENIDADGAYFKFRFKFDEQLFASRKAQLNPSLEPKGTR